MLLLWLVLVVGSTVWLGIDAAARDWSGSLFAKSTAQWVLGALLLWIVIFPLYLYLRDRAPLKNAAPPSSGSVGAWGTQVTSVAGPTGGWAPPTSSTTTSASTPPSSVPPPGWR